MRGTWQARRLSASMRVEEFAFKRDHPRQIDRYIDFFGGAGSGGSTKSVRRLEGCESHRIATDQLFGGRREPI